MNSVAEKIKVKKSSILEQDNKKVVMKASQEPEGLHCLHAQNSKKEKFCSEKRAVGPCALELQ